MAVSNDAAQRYLELMKQALTFSLWKEPGVPIEIHNENRSLPLKWIVRLASWILKKAHIQLVKVVECSDAARVEGKIWPVQAHTMVGSMRLDNVQFCVENVLRDKVPGDLIETGVWRGVCIFMRAILTAYGITDRRVFVTDSFEGLPRPDEVRYPQDRGDTHYTSRFLAVSQEEVEENFRKYGLLDQQVVFLKGWFKDTLPGAPIERLSVMRLDGDMYQSTMDALVNLYPKLSAGGYCIIDDYALSGCRRAVDDFRTIHGIQDAIHCIDWSGIYWRKGSNA